MTRTTPPQRIADTIPGQIYYNEIISCPALRTRGKVSWNADKVFPELEAKTPLGCIRGPTVSPVGVHGHWLTQERRAS